MKVYLVGGAVRDELLGLPVIERDYVVVGASPEAMARLGYRAVGRDFPVFLHPDTAEEYALARTERKTGPGHTGFEFHASPDVTLEEDLQRRDLTINAMAKDDGGTIIDPCGGQADLEAGILRHVSAAFTEDPLRILRIARFKAKLASHGFDIAPETAVLIRSMIADNLLEELSADRIVGELDKALATRSPAVFFSCLHELGAGQRLWPEITAEDIARLAASRCHHPEAGFAMLLLDKSTDVIEAMTRRLRCANLRRELALLANRHLDTWSRFTALSAEQIAETLFACDALRKKQRFETFAMIADEMLDADISTQWLQAASIMAGVRSQDLPGELTGPALGKKIREEQVRAVAEAFGV